MIHLMSVTRLKKQDEASHTGSEERTDSTTVLLSQRQTKRPDYYGVWANTTTALSEPNTVKKALSCPEKEDWKEAMEAEYKSLCANQVWDLVPPPENCKTISSKWVYKCKRGENGDVERYKARLVAQGYTQRPGIDYEETSSPVVRFESVRSVIALDVHKDMKLHQMDVKTAFLNGELSEEVFMKQPKGFVKEGEKDLVCRLKKSIYGLKQSPHCWNTALDSHMKKMKYVQTKADPCIYVFKDKTETVIIAVYVDDILIAGTSNKKIAEVKAAIANRFEVKDMGELHYFLGVKIVRDSQAGTIWLGQPSYIYN